MDKQEKIIERRQHPRYQLSDNILVFNETTFGQIINFSEGGLAFSYLINKDIVQEIFVELSILNSSSGFYMENITCKTVNTSDSTPIHPTGSTIVRRNGVQFDNLTADQLQQIESFLEENRGAISKTHETSH